MIINSTLIFCLIPELENQLMGLRIAKVSISADQRDLLFSLRGKDKKAALYFSTHSENCRIEMWDEDEAQQHSRDFGKTNLFWYAVGGHVRSVEQADFDRIVRISCEKKTQFGAGEAFDLLFELTGRNANAVLVNPDRTIVD